MKQQTMLNNILRVKGLRINKIYTQSFFIDKELISRFNLFYLQLDTDWYSISISEGILRFLPESPPGVVRIDEISDSFKYPISELEGLFTEQKIKDVTIINENDYVKGVEFSLSNGYIFSIKDKEDNHSWSCENNA